MNEEKKEVNEIEVICKNTNTTLRVKAGITISQIIDIANLKNEFPILGAYINNKVQNLNYKIFIPKTIEFIDINNVNGRRMYAMSLMFLLYKATKEILPKSELIIRHSMSNGFYAEIEKIDKDLDIELIERIKNRMRELVIENIPFTKEIIPAENAIGLYEEKGMREKSELIKTLNRLYANVDYLGNTVNHFYYELVPSTSYLEVFDLVSFDKGMMLIMPNKKNPKELSNGRSKQRKMFSVFQEYEQWVHILGTPYVSELNKVVEKKDEIKLIQISEALHEKKYSNIADSIHKRADEVKIVLLAGPSSSGKTTSCRRLSTQLAVLGYKPVQISLDDYFLDREFTPIDKDGNYDFEALEALDIELFNTQMNMLMNSEEVSIPKFNFITGKKEYNGHLLKMEENSILIVEGIHALNPKLTEKIDRKNKFHVFVSAITQVSLDRHNLISSSDNRLIRRMVRDNNYRGYSALDSLSRWQSVRNGEEKHIFPYQENADEIFNSSLLYEIGVLKPYAETLLNAVPQNRVEYAEAKRLLSFLSNFKTIGHEFIPPTSIMREFLGGSSFDY